MVNPDRRNDDAFMQGFLVCLSTLIHLDGGTNVRAEELFREAGAPSAKECRRLGLTEFDRINLWKLRKSDNHYLAPNRSYQHGTYEGQG